MYDDLQCISAVRCGLGESPVWSQTAQRLYWLDIGVPSTLFEWDRASRRTRGWPLPELAGGLTLSRSDEVVVVSQSGIGQFDRATGTLRLLASAPQAMGELRFNDCGCDPSGRLWLGTVPNEFARDRTDEQDRGESSGEIWCCDTDLSWRRMASGFGCPNTFVWSADGSYFYVADSAVKKIYAYRFDNAAGLIRDRCVLTQQANLGVPDGSAIDSDGCIWNARWGASCIARFAPDGQLLRVVPVPVAHVTSCAFGGERLEQLYVTTASFGLSPQHRASQPLAGGVFCFTPEAPGLAPGRFASMT